MELIQVSKSFSVETEKIEAVKNASLKIEPGKFYVIIGHSGSGKSTLINLLGVLTKPDSGEIRMNERNIKEWNDKKLSQLRKTHIGFIFQNYLLDPYLKAYENIMLPMLVNPQIKAKERKTKSMELLKMVGLIDRANHYPRQLSGGEQQRVAIARSLANNPDIILADEPTGNLDKENEQIIFKKLKELTELGKSVVVVSHSNEIKQYADIILRMDHGHLEETHEKVL